MLAGIPASLWFEWVEYSAEEPFGFPAQNLLFGHLIANIACFLGSRDVSPGDFMLHLAPLAEEGDIFDTFDRRLRLPPLAACGAGTT